MHRKVFLEFAPIACVTKTRRSEYLLPTCVCSGKNVATVEVLCYPVFLRFCKTFCRHWFVDEHRSDELLR